MMMKTLSELADLMNWINHERNYFSKDPYFNYFSKWSSDNITQHIKEAISHDAKSFETGGFTFNIKQHFIEVIPDKIIVSRRLFFPVRQLNKNHMENKV